ncbi:hypothetical protein [Nocardia sp. NPDC051463]|uniref:hypothetical protein n=1 Tax=Nocardia sp. NPDC051463 TaxID=3154845 RepID=UPI00344D57B8
MKRTLQPRQSRVAVEKYGMERILRELRRDLREGVYRPAPARRAISHGSIATTTPQFFIVAAPPDA